MREGPSNSLSEALLGHIWLSEQSGKGGDPKCQLITKGLSEENKSIQSAKGINRKPVRGRRAYKTILDSVPPQLPELFPQWKSGYYQRMVNYQEPYEARILRSVL